MSTDHEELKIDIAMELDEVEITFWVASLAFEGDLPAAIFHIGLLLDDAASWSVKPQLVVVFHTNAGHVTLGDDVYNRYRDVATGNPQSPCHGTNGSGQARRAMRSDPLSQRMAKLRHNRRYQNQH